MMSKFDEAAVRITVIYNLYYHVNRFVESSEDFGVNAKSLKVATAFLLLRLLKIKDEESWSKCLNIA